MENKDEEMDFLIVVVSSTSVMQKIEKRPKDVYKYKLKRQRHQQREVFGVNSACEPLVAVSGASIVRGFRGRRP